MMQNTESKMYANLWKKIGSHGIMTFSTCSGNRVSSRSVSVVVIDSIFYCQTDETYLKYNQILKNSNVALCFKNFSIEGICETAGKPFDKNNINFLKAFKKYFYTAYKLYSKIPTERILKIKPTLIYSWNYELTKPYMEYFYFKDFTYKKEYK